MWRKMKAARIACGAALLLSSADAFVTPSANFARPALVPAHLFSQAPILPDLSTPPARMQKLYLAFGNIYDRHAMAQGSKGKVNGLQALGKCSVRSRALGLRMLDSQVHITS